MKRLRKIKKNLVLGLISTVCLYTTALSVPSVPLQADTYTWVGGLDANDMTYINNWNPNDGPPGVNDAMLFTTTANPCYLYSAESMEVDDVQFDVTDVVVTVNGSFTLDNNIINQSGVVSTFDIFEGGSFYFDGNTLQSGGTTVFNIDSAYNIINLSTLYVEVPDTSSCHVNLSRGGSLFITSGSPITVGPLASSSPSDEILLDDVLTFGDGTDTTIAGAFTGTASFNKQGSGTVTLTGSSTYSGSATVLGGRLSVNGYLPGVVTVVSGAILGGNGEISGAVSIQSGANLSPGNSIGTLTVGSLTLDSGSTTTIEIDPASSSKIVVNGAAALDGEVVVVQDAGNYSRSGSYEILTAGSMTGGFTGVTGGLPGFQFLLLRLGNATYLNYAPDSIDTHGLIGNLLKVADYLNTYAPVTPQYVGLTALTGLPLQSALGSVSPSHNAFSTYASQQTAFSLSALVNNHLADSRASGWNRLCCCEETPCCMPITLWAKGYFQHAQQASDSLNPAFHYTTEAGLIACDFALSSLSLFGVGGGAAQTHLKDQWEDGKAAITEYFATVYGSFSMGCFYLEPSFWVIYNGVRNHRYIQYSAFDYVAAAKYKGWQMVPHLEVGYDYSLSWALIEPFISLDWAVNRNDDYQEHGAESLDMSVRKHTSSMLQSQCGLRFFEEFSLGWGSVSVREGVSYMNRALFNTGKVTSAIAGADQYFTLSAFDQSLNLVAINAALSAQAAGVPNFVISFEYDGEFGNSYQANQGTLKLAWMF